VKICLCVCYVVIGIADERGMLWVCIYTEIMSDFRNAGHGLLFLFLKSSWSVLACIAALYICVAWLLLCGCWGVDVWTIFACVCVCETERERKLRF